MARVITSEPFAGYRTCSRPRVFDPEHGELGARDEDCPGYESEPCQIVREEVQFTFRDNGSDGAPGMDHEGIERSTVRFMPADGDWECPHCAHPMASFSPEARGEYVHLSEQHPDELRRRSLKQDKRAEEQLSIAERQAKALEALAGQAAESARVAALEAELAELRKLLDGQAKPKAAAK
jgi:LmbE family N-acetylglucosaminyl deacetylase